MIGLWYIRPNSSELFEEFTRILHTCEEWLHKPKSIKKTRLICTPSSSSHSRITEDTKTPGNCDESVKPSSDDLVKALEKLKQTNIYIKGKKSIFKAIEYLAWYGAFYIKYTMYTI